MAASQNSLLSRMRSARAPAPSAGRTHAANGDGLSRSLTASHAQAVSSTSNLSLFLTNLRLLDLDLLPDWPDINARTFTNKDAAQGQKKRIQCVEWALYQLFSLWDPDETRIVSTPSLAPWSLAQSRANTLLTEVAAFLSSPRPTPVYESASGLVAMPRTGEEERCFRKRCRVAQNHAGRMQG